MSRLFPGKQLPVRDPREQIPYLVNYYRHTVYPATHRRLAERVKELGLSLTDDELLILAALDTPLRVQEFLNTQIHYNNDHLSPEQEETAYPPRLILRLGLAHCFEGAMFAYAVNYLHGYEPRLCLLEAYQDAEHNLVVYQETEGNLYGCNAHSRYPHLDGRAPQFHTVRALAESYAPWYYSDRTKNPQDVTLVGYSDPFDLTKKFGAAWMASEEHLWDIYYTYIDDTVTFHYLNDDSERTHLYPMVNSLKNNWIQVDAQGKPFVSMENLPRGAIPLWDEFWRVHVPGELPAQGPAREIELAFFKLTGTTPIDLEDNASDLQWFLAAGYRIDQLMTRN